MTADPHAILTAALTGLPQGMAPERVATLLLAELTTAGLLCSEPRVWRSGDAEPGEDVRAVLDRGGLILEPATDEHSVWADDGYSWQDWPDAVCERGPLVEVTLPEPVRE